MTGRHFTIIFAGLLVVVSCARDVTPGRDRDRSGEAATAIRKEALENKSVERVEFAGAAPVIGEVPEEYLAKVYAELEGLTGANRSEFELLRSESVQWSDGGLGCPEPGMAYQQVPVDGYWLVVMFQGEQYDYRVGSRGYLRLCTTPSRPGYGVPRQ